MFSPKRSLRSYQLEDFEKSKDKEAYAYLYDMGLGKTKITTDVACHLKATGKIDTCVIIVKAAVIRNWYDPVTETGELCKDTWDGLDPKYYVWRGLSTKKELAELTEIKKHKGMRYLLINVEAFQVKLRSTRENLMTFFRGLDPNRTLVVVDEATDIKTQDSNRTMTIKLITKAFKYKRILTGTVIAERPEDCYSLYDFLNPRFWRFPSYKSFCKYYVIFHSIYEQGKIIFSRKVGYRKLDELSAIIMNPNIAVRRTWDDVPENERPKDLIESYVYCSMTKEQNKTYSEIENNLYTVLESGGEVDIKMVMHKYSKLCQVASGVLHTSEGKEILDIKNDKLAKLKELIENHAGKVVVHSLIFSDAVIEDIVKELEKDYPEQVISYTGKTDIDVRKTLIDEFQDPESKKKIFVTNKTGAFGITLTEADLHIFYNVGYSMNTFEQAKKRVHRLGQKKTVNIIYLVTENTEDEICVKRLANKAGIANYIYKKGKASTGAATFLLIKRGMFEQIEKEEAC